MNRRFEVIIIGMGPAGLAAGVELARGGAEVALIDENPSPGGQVYRRPPAEFTLEDESFLGLRYQAGRRLIGQFERWRDKITVLNETLAWGFFEGESIALVQGDQIELVGYQKMILSEGAMERSIPFPGWTLPGVLTVGGLQKLLLQQRVLPGKRFVLSGASPLLLSVAASLLKAGGEIVALCDATRPSETSKLIPEVMRQKGLVREVLSYLFPVIKGSVPTHRPASVIAASGEGRVQEVSLARLDDDWRPVPGTEKRVQTDILAVSYGFLPLARLTRLCGCEHVYDPVQKLWRPEVDEVMRTSLPDIYTAGDSAGVGGADLAEVEGRIAAVDILAELGRISQAERKSRLEKLFREKKRINRYARLLNRIFAPRDGLFSIMDEDTIVCRCERVTAGTVLDGIAKGFRNINEIKRTRIAMGPCQGRTCESIVAEMMRQRGIPVEEIGYLRLRPPLTPIPLRVFESYASNQA